MFARMSHSLLAVAVVACGGIGIGGAAAAQSTGGVILWNTLDSAQDVQHSRIGPGGTLVGSRYAFEPGEFGNGYVRKATGNNYIRFPADTFAQVKERGAVAVWVNPKVPYPAPYQYGIFGFVNAAYVGDGSIFLGWADTVTAGNDLAGSVYFGTGPDITAYTQGARFAATPGTPFHAAMAWDIDGIEGSADTIRVYRDGMLVARTSGRWNAEGAVRPDFIVGASPDSGGYDKYIVDNLVLYDWAKTDFSDRFSEDPSGGQATLRIANLIFTMGENPAEAADGGDAGDEADTTAGGKLLGVRIVMSADLVLSADGDGLAPASETGFLKIGGWQVAIPAGGFKAHEDVFRYAARVAGQKVVLELKNTSGDTWSVRLIVRRGNTTEFSDPTPVSLRIGNDVGRSSVDLRGRIHGSSPAASAAGASTPVR